MSARSVLLIVLSSLLVAVVANPPYTYTEGFFNAADAVFMNCTYDVRGTTGAVKTGDLPITLSTKGAVITYINVLNNKPAKEQGTIIKTAGGTGSSFVTFHLVSVETHGFLFHFDMRGRTPAGTTEPPLIGNCRQK